MVLIGLECHFQYSSILGLSSRNSNWILKVHSEIWELFEIAGFLILCRVILLFMFTIDWLQSQRDSVFMHRDRGGLGHDLEVKSECVPIEIGHCKHDWTFAIVKYLGRLV